MAFSRRVSPSVRLLELLVFCTDVDFEEEEEDEGLLPRAPASSGLGLLLLVSAFRLMGSPSCEGLALGPCSFLVAFSRRVSPSPEEEGDVEVLSSRSASVGVRSRRGFLGDILTSGVTEVFSTRFVWREYITWTI